LAPEPIALEHVGGFGTWAQQSAVCAPITSRTHRLRMRREYGEQDGDGGAFPGRDVRISCAHLIHRSTYAGSRRWRALLGCGPRHRAPSCAASAASPPRLLRPPTLHARILRRGAAEAANRGATTQRTGAGRRTGARPARAAPLREASLCGVAGRPRVCPAAGPVDPGPGYQAGIRPGSAHNSRGPTLRSNQTSRAEHFCKRNPGHLFLSSGRK
jgi:hypothetical protein